MPRTRSGIALVATMLALAGCKTLTPANAIAGGLTALQGLFISDQQELEIGQQTKLKVLADTPEYPNPIVRDYVTKIGNKMVAQCERSQLAFEFHVIDSPEVNAFAAPGGFVFVTVPLLRLMTNEAELAGVVGHEVGHVAKRHSVRGIQESLVAHGIEVATLGKDADKLTQTGANIAANLILKGFDRGKEEEADKLGAQYAYQAGYDPQQLGVFLDALGKAVGDTPAWLIPVADHPRSDDRIKLLGDFIDVQHYATTGKVTDEADFKSNVLDQLGPAPVTASPAPVAAPSGGATPLPAG